VTDRCKVNSEICLLLEPYAAVYVEIPKVACTSLKVAIASTLDIELEQGGDPHQTEFPTVSPDIDDGALFPELFSFTFVRNPWDRLVSCYRDKIAGEVHGFTASTIRPGVADCLARYDAFEADMTFEDFVTVVASIADSDADEHFRSQHTFVMNRSKKIGIDFVGRFEHLEHDFEHVERHLGMPKSSLPHLQAVNNPVHYAEYYSVGTRDKVAERYRTDIEVFNYKFRRGVQLT
jgi:chondroitin 4-sulfotransferase 11